MINLINIGMCIIIHIPKKSKQETGNNNMSEKVEKMKAMLEKMDKMTLAPAGESDGIRNNEGRRKKLL